MDALSDVSLLLFVVVVVLVVVMCFPPNSRSSSFWVLAAPAEEGYRDDEWMFEGSLKWRQQVSVSSLFPPY